MLMPLFSAACATFQPVPDGRYDIYVIRQVATEYPGPKFAWFQGIGDATRAGAESRCEHWRAVTAYNNRVIDPCQSAILRLGEALAGSPNVYVIATERAEHRWDPMLVSSAWFMVYGAETAAQCNTIRDTLRARSEMTHRRAGVLAPSWRNVTCRPAVLTIEPDPGATP
jgi:hypothetical protein